MKYKIDLVAALTTLTSAEEKRMVEVGRQRLARMEKSGQWEKGEDFFLDMGKLKSGRKRDLGKDDKEEVQLELEEIRQLLLQSTNDQDEEHVEDVEVIEVFSKDPGVRMPPLKRVKVEPCPETPPPSLPPTPSSHLEDIEEIEVLEVVGKPLPKESNLRKIKIEGNAETPSSSAPPTPCGSPVSEVAKEYSIKMEPEVDVHVDVAPQTEGLGEDGVGVEVPLVEEALVEQALVGQALVEQASVEQALSFCRLCYITFTSHSEQLPHEQQVCSAAFLVKISCKLNVSSAQVHTSEEDREVLNSDMTCLTLEDFKNNCGICGLKFLTKSSVKYHQKVEHRVGVERTVQCEKCKKVMKPSSIYLHRKTHQEKQCVCKLCYASYHTLADLKKHKENKHSEDQEFLQQEITQDDLKYKCGGCDLKFVAEKFLDNHVKSHKSKPTKKVRACKLCYKPFKYTRELKHHEERQHKREANFLHREILESDLIFACLKCDKKFVSENLLGSHSREHEMENYSHLKSESYDKIKNKYECKFCYSFHQRFLGLLDHIHLAHKSDLGRIDEKIITADLIYPCDGCDKRFITEDVLSYHKNRFHSSKPKKNYLAKTQKCESCPEAFIYFNTLRKHCLKSHGTKIQRPIETLQCKLCEKPVRGKGNLATHIKKRHNSVKEMNALKMDRIDEASLQHKCGYCYKKFLTKDVLACHRAYCKSIDRKNQKCDFCPETFRHRHTLRRHCLTKHNKKLREKVVSCRLCDKSIRGSKNLRAHEKNIHKSAEEIEALKLDKIEDADLVFSCQYCNKRFLNEKVLRHHNTFCYGRASQETSRRDCSLCLVEFPSTRVLKEHINNVHRTNDEEVKALKSPDECLLKSKCKFCQAELLNRHVLKYHFDKVHKEEESKRTWSCEFCRKEFKPDRMRTSMVVQHMRDDHDLPDYNCLEGKVFAHKEFGNQARQNFQLMLAKMIGIKK